MEIQEIVKTITNAFANLASKEGVSFEIGEVTSAQGLMILSITYDHTKYGIQISDWTANSKPKN